jgi:hypothetical protein
VRGTRRNDFGREEDVLKICHEQKKKKKERKKRNQYLF